MKEVINMMIENNVLDNIRLANIYIDNMDAIVKIVNTNKQEIVLVIN